MFSEPGYISLGDTYKSKLDKPKRRLHPSRASTRHTHTDRVVGLGKEPLPTADATTPFLRDMAWTPCSLLLSQLLAAAGQPVASCRCSVVEW